MNIPTKNISKQSLGRVTIVPKGDYDNSTQYYALDLITHGGASYLAKQSSKGKEPSSDPSSEGYAYWQLIATDGAGAPYVDNGILSWA